LVREKNQTWHLQVFSPYTLEYLFEPGGDHGVSRIKTPAGIGLFLSKMLTPTIPLHQWLRHLRLNLPMYAPGAAIVPVAAQPPVSRGIPREMDARIAAAKTTESRRPRAQDSSPHPAR
jgi:hypothetical protein